MAYICIVSSVRLLLTLNSVTYGLLDLFVYAVRLFLLVYAILSLFRLSIVPFMIF